MFQELQIFIIMSLTNQYNTLENNHAFRELVYVDNGTINVNAENYKGQLKKMSL